MEQLDFVFVFCKVSTEVREHTVVLNFVVLRFVRQPAYPELSASHLHCLTACQFDKKGSVLQLYGFCKKHSDANKYNESDNIINK